MVAATFQFGNHFMEKLDADGYYLVDKVPVVTNFALETLRESDQTKFFHFVRSVWQPEFILMYSHGKYHEVTCAKPYVFMNGHTRISNALVHYDKGVLNIHDDNAVQSVLQIAEKISRSAVNAQFVGDHILSCNYICFLHWTDEMKKMFLSLDGDYSWIGYN